MINDEIFDTRTKIAMVKSICKAVFLVSFIGTLVFIGLAWSSFNLAVCGCQVMPLSYVATIIWHVFAVVGVLAFVVFGVCSCVEKCKNLLANLS